MLVFRSCLTFHLATLCLINVIGLLIFYFHRRHFTSWYVIDRDSMCDLSNPFSDYCDLRGDIRIHGNSSTVFIVTNGKTITGAGNNSSITIKPYPRKPDYYGTINVMEWTVKTVSDQESAPICTHTHDVPAIIFSVASYASYNFYHSISDVIIPLYSETLELKREVHFLVTNYNPDWVSRFYSIIKTLSRYPPVNIGMERDTIHCYKRTIVGLERKLPFDLDVSKLPDNVTMMNFKRLISNTYSLKRSRLEKGSFNDPKIKPRLLIVTRKKIRRLRNLEDVVKMARELGLDVVVAEPKDTKNGVAEFGRLVNSCDVLMGVHGAGLAYWMFLPDEAVLIQVVPFGMKYFANVTYGDPAVSTSLKYIEYEANMNESSLVDRYPSDHPIFTDPIAIHKQGWENALSCYLNQDVTLNIDRFRCTLAEALHLLRH